jgi:hypothetical protein
MMSQTSTPNEGQKRAKKRAKPKNVTLPFSLGVISAPSEPTSELFGTDCYLIPNRGKVRVFDSPVQCQDFCLANDIPYVPLSKVNWLPSPVAFEGMGNIAQAIERYEQIAQLKNKRELPIVASKSLMTKIKKKMGKQTKQSLEPRKFVYPERRLSPQEVETLENMGLIPVVQELGETTRLLTLRLDTRTMNRLRSLQRKLGIDLSQLVRLALIKGLKILETEQTHQKT